MSDFTEKVRVMLDGITKGSWTLDEYGRIMVGHDQLLVHGVAIPCGNHKDLSKAKANGMLLFNAPTILREAIERIEALEKVAEAARDIVTYGSVEPDKGMDGDTIVDTWRFAVMQDALSALDTKEKS